QDMRAAVAPTADHRALDHGAAANVGRGFDHAAARPRLLAKRDAGPEDGVRPNGGARGDARVVADERRRLDLLEVVELDSLAQPDVATQADAGNVQVHR